MLPAGTARRLDDDEKGIDTIHSPGGGQQMTVVNESGLYSLILTSQKDTAKRFKKWATAEVLPAPPRRGFSNTAPGAPPDSRRNDPDNAA